MRDTTSTQETEAAKATETTNIAELDSNTASIPLSAPTVYFVHPKYDYSFEKTETIHLTAKFNEAAAYHKEAENNAEPMAKDLETHFSTLKNALNTHEMPDEKAIKKAFDWLNTIQAPDIHYRVNICSHMSPMAYKGGEALNEIAHKVGQIYGIDYMVR